jgi:hypothetical protein
LRNRNASQTSTQPLIDSAKTCRNRRDDAIRYSTKGRTSCMAEQESIKVFRWHSKPYGSPITGLGSSIYVRGSRKQDCPDFSNSSWQISNVGLDLFHDNNLASRFD